MDVAERHENDGKNLDQWQLTAAKKASREITKNKEGLTTNWKLSTKIMIQYQNEEYNNAIKWKKRWAGKIQAQPTKWQENRNIENIYLLFLILLRLLTINAFAQPRVPQGVGPTRLEPRKNMAAVRKLITCR
jgi:hypothetical protein